MPNTHIHGHLEPELQQLDSKSIIELNTHAAEDLAQRSVAGSVIVLLALISSAYASPIIKDAPQLVYTLIGFMTLIAMSRIYIVHLILKRTYLIDTLRRILTVILLSGSAIWGGYMGLSWYWYGPIPPNMVIMMFTIGIAAGAATALFIWLELSQLYLLLIFTPAMLATVINWHESSVSIIFGLSAYFIFLLVQSKRTHAEYWRSLSLNKHLQVQKEASEKANQLAKKASQAKSEFLSSMSHELRTPLNAINGFTQLIRSDKQSPPSPEQLECLNHIMKASDHLLLLVNQVLDLAKIESGHLEVQLGEVDVNQVVNDCLPFVRPLAIEKHVELKVGKVYPGLRVLADETHLKQVLLNLLNNAVKYNVAGGDVRLDFNIINRHLLFKITDTGIGISEQHQKDMFKSFSRLGQENSSIEGSGVGLVITKSLLETMRSKLEFSSVENKGSCFWFKLPLVHDNFRLH